jgi:hypothetical protein
VGGNDVTEESSADEIAFKIITLGTPLVNRCKVGRVVVCALTPRFPMSEFRFKKYVRKKKKSGTNNINLCILKRHKNSIQYYREN